MFWIQIHTQVRNQSLLKQKIGKIERSTVRFGHYRSIVRLMLNRSGELQPWPNTNPNINTNTNTNANTKMIKKYKSEGMCFLLIMKKNWLGPSHWITLTMVNFKLLFKLLFFEWCCASFLPCLAPEQLHSNQILVKPEVGNINVLIWIMTKESWPSFVERQKTQQLKKNWIEAQSGFNLKEVHCKKHKTGKLPKNLVLVFYRRLETILKKIIFFEKIVVPQNTHPNMNTTRE